VAAAVTAAFAAQGWLAPAIWPAQPAAGAGRLN